MTLVVDSSALIAILLREDGADAFSQALMEASDVCLSAVILHETRVVFARRMTLTDTRQVDALLALFDARIVAFDEVQADLAFEGFVRFGSGRYGLNLADCFSYALARLLDAPLLFKGEDFARTDVKRAL